MSRGVPTSTLSLTPEDSGLGVGVTDPEPRNLCVYLERPTFSLFEDPEIKSRVSWKFHLLPRPSISRSGFLRVGPLQPTLRTDTRTQCIRSTGDPESKDNEGSQTPVSVSKARDRTGNEGLSVVIGIAATCDRPVNDTWPVARL